MSMKMKLRALFNRPKKRLYAAGIRKGDTVLDFGCGPGIYSFAASSIAGGDGKVYAMDVVKDAVDEVKNRAERKKNKNIVPVHSGLDTGLADNSVDVILLYNVFHHLDNPGQIIRELHRVIKPGGTLSFYDKHIGAAGVAREKTAGELFEFQEKRSETSLFKPVK